MFESNIRRIQHLGLPVSDILRSVEWYSGILGFRLKYETVITGKEGDIRVAFMELGDFVIEMYQLSGRELEEIIGREHGHIDHLAFDVDDIDDVYGKLSAADIKTLEGAPEFLPFWENGVRYVTILGPDNEKIEFNQKL